MYTLPPLAALLAQSLSSASSLLEPAPVVAAAQAAAQAAAPAVEAAAQLAPVAAPVAAQLAQAAQLAALPAAALPVSGISGVSGIYGLLWLLAIPAALALFALLLRRRPESERLLKILETQSLGGRRALILAQLGNEALLLSSSEAGVTLLAARPAPQQRPAPAQQRAPERAEGRAPAPSPANARPSFARALLERLVPAREPQLATAGAPVARPTSFGALLEETADDQELRRKLVAGRRGRVS
jgi:flagellar biogenesis protein FliO